MKTLSSNENEKKKTFSSKKISTTLFHSRIFNVGQESHFLLVCSTLCFHFVLDTSVKHKWKIISEKRPFFVEDEVSLKNLLFLPRLFSCQSWLSNVLYGVDNSELLCSWHCCSCAVVTNLDSEDNCVWSVREVVTELLPRKSKEAYDKAWKDFKNHCQILGKPEEAHFMGYFDYLHWEKQLKSSTLWSLFFKLNHSYQVEFGQKLQKAHPCLTLQLKQYNAGYEYEVAQTFTQFEIEAFLVMSHDGHAGFWLLEKAAATAYSGGLRIAELRSLKLRDLKDTSDGIWVEYIPSQQHGEVKKSRFLVSRNFENPAKCFTSHVTAYIDTLKSCLKKLDMNSDLFKTCTKGGGFSKIFIGINYLCKIPMEIATALKLGNPASYAGHSFCRSSATQLANVGAKSADVRQFYNWKHDTTANQFIEKSEVHGQKIGHMMVGMSTRTSDMPEVMNCSGSSSNC